MYLSVFYESLKVPPVVVADGYVDHMDPTLPYGSEVWFKGNGMVAVEASSITWKFASLVENFFEMKFLMSLCRRVVYGFVELHCARICASVLSVELHLLQVTIVCGIALFKFTLSLFIPLRSFNAVNKKWQCLNKSMLKNHSFSCLSAK